MGSIAVINFISRQKTQTRQGLKALLDYCSRNAKTTYNGKQLVTGINCVAQSAYNEMMNTKLRYKKANGRMYYHLLQSFHPDEQLTPETAHEIAIRFAEENFKGYEVLVATHVDRDHIHSHFVINSVNAENSYKYHSDNKEIQQLRDSSDKLCLEYGLSVIKSAPSKTKGMSSREYRSADKGQSWKLDLAMAIDEAMCYAVSREHFIRLMEMEGYQVNWIDTRKYITYTCPNGMKCRDNKLHEEKYLKEAMTNEFKIRKKITERIEGSGETRFGAGGSDRDLRFDNGEELAGADSVSTDADRYAQYNDEHDGDVGNKGTDDRFYESANRRPSGERQSDRTNLDGVSEYTSETSGADSSGNLNLAGEFWVTGWEYERGILEEALLGRGADQEQLEEDYSSFAYPNDSLNHLGSDTAYLAAELMGIIDNDSHTDDCTTIKKPRHERKNTKSDGFKMRGM